jgi:hypothetical protein
MKDREEYMWDKESDQGSLFYTLDEYEMAKTASYWAGVIVASIGWIVLGVVAFLFYIR